MYMLEQNFAEVYTKFKMHLYSKIFKELDKSSRSLTAIEVLCVEIIYALGNPTVNEFASFAKLSAPNAAYKVNNLIRKEYVTKTRSETDKREYHLDVTDKYLKDYGLTYDYIGTVMERIRSRLSAEEVKGLENALQIISKELMPEISIKRRFDDRASSEDGRRQ